MSNSNCENCPNRNFMEENGGCRASDLPKVLRKKPLNYCQVISESIRREQMDSFASTVGVKLSTGMALGASYAPTFVNGRVTTAVGKRWKKIHGAH